VTLDNADPAAGPGSALPHDGPADGGPPPGDDPPGDDGAGEGGEGAPRRRSKRWLVEWALVLAVALLVALLARTFVVQTYYIPSGSMEPTLQIGDRIIVDKLSYHLHPVHRGDIVVFRRPPAENCDPGQPPVADLVKRVIGLPGETISARNGQVYIDGKVLPEPWLPKEYAYTSPFGPLKIPKGDYFMMGDHRDDSCDSRDWGPLPRSYIVGRVVMRIWPLSRLKFF
jgi:signal peptidase I